jgi:FkbM family methyltransferase
MRFVDVGSNHGYYCLVAAHELGPLGTVYSFEPQRALYTLQLRTVIANGLEARIFLKNAAVGDRAGTAALSVPTEWSGGATLLAEPLDAFGETSSEEVEVLTLDDVFAGKSVDFVKVDVEGAEPQVIAGMRQVLDENPDIQLGLEWHGGPRAQSDMLGELADRGFIPHAINFSGDLHAVSYSWLHDLTFDPMIIFRRVTT